MRSLLAVVLAAAAFVLLPGTPALAWAAPPAGAHGVGVGQYLPPGTAVRSPDGRFRLTQQTDGNLVLYAPEGALWSTRTRGAGNATYLQSDGNLVTYSAAHRALWASNTGGRGGVRLAVQSDGNLVLYTAAGAAVWQTGTARRATPPLGYAGTANQVLAVAAARSSSTTATLTGWRRTPSGWIQQIAPTSAWVGAAGVGQAAEGTSRTPAGTFTLTQTFGRIANPGTRLPWFTTDRYDWWDENPSSPTYNLHVRRTTSPGGASENLYLTGAAYDAAVVIDYNTARVPGAGSGMFLHVSTGAPTAGCVAIPRAGLISVLRWLDPAARPAIRIAVG